MNTGDLLEEDQTGCGGSCWAARVPDRALQVLVHNTQPHTPLHNHTLHYTTLHSTTHH